MTALRLAVGPLMQQGSAPTLDEAGLIQWKADSGADHFWLFNGAYGPFDTIDDEIGTMGMTMPSGDSPSSVTGPTAAFTAATQFSDDRVGHVGAETVNLNQDFTIGFWIKTTDTLGIVLSGRTSSTEYWYLINRDTPANLKWQVDPAAHAGAAYSAGVDIDDGAWHYVHVWREYSATAGSDVWGFAVDDGTPVTTTRSSFSPSVPPAAQAVEELFVGSQNSGSVFMSMSFQHLAVWLGKVLSPAERTTDYEAEQGTPP